MNWDSSPTMMFPQVQVQTPSKDHSELPTRNHGSGAACPFHHPAAGPGSFVW